jgi:hypothetical protein
MGSAGGSGVMNHLFDPLELFIKPDKPAAPEAPPPPPAPAVMPIADDEETARARRRRTAELSARSGRISTMLSDPAETLG